MCSSDLFDEPAGGTLTLKAANDTRAAVAVDYTVTDLAAGRRVLEGRCAVPPDGLASVAALRETPGGFYLIEWTGGAEGKNHYAADIYHGLEPERYLACMEKAGFRNELEGFD